MRENTIKKVFKAMLTKFGYDGYCDIEDYEDGCYDVRFVQLDDRKIDKYFTEFSQLEKSMLKPLGAESVSHDRMDAFPNGFASYKFILQF